MNWAFILLQLVVFVGLMSLMVTAIYYLRHRHAKALALREGMDLSDTEDGGEFLKRYIPPEHRRKPLVEHKTSLFASRPLFYFACTLVPVLFLGFTGFNYYSNRVEFLNEITLEDSEASNLIARRYSFIDTVGLHAPTLEEVSAAFDPRKIFVVFKKNNNSDSSAKAWMQHLENSQLKYRTCNYKRISKCKLHRNVIAVIDLSQASETTLDTLYKRQANILSYGAPTDIAANGGMLPGLTFEEQSDWTGNDFALIGDKELTLGMDAGLRFTVPRMSDVYQVKSDNPQAITMYSDGVAGGPRNARLHATVHQNSRIVWVDFSPIEKQNQQDIQEQYDSLMAGVYRYVANQDYTSVATWPEGAKFAAFLEQDTEDLYTASDRVAAFFLENDYPITWYALSDLAQKHRESTQKIADTGEIACHGDNHDIFIRYSLGEQVERLARCIKVMEQLTGQRPMGFRPPTEAHNNDTISAIVNVGMTHMFAENFTRALVPHLKLAVGTDHSLVSLPRGITDDYYLWDTLALNSQKSTARMLDELQWIKETGSLFSFSFHSQFMVNDDNFNVVKTLAHTIGNDRSVWMDTAGGISDWWRVRHSLLQGIDVSEDDFKIYSPVLLSVDELGRLQSTALEYVAPPVVFAEHEEDG